MIDYKSATDKLNSFIEWVHWNRFGRMDQIDYYKSKLLDTRNKRLADSLKREIHLLKTENKWL